MRINEIYDTSDLFPNKYIYIILISINIFKKEISNSNL